MTAPDASGFAHRFVPGNSEGPTLLLLHGTGGDENDLLPLGRELLPGAAMLSPRGRVLENGMPRFFRRFGEGRFDLEDLKVQTELLATFIREAAAKYGFDSSKLIAVGYSNGANIAGSLLLTEPRLLAGAILFRPMVPFVPESLPDLSAIPVYLSAGRRDPIIPPQQTSALADMLTNAGAAVSMHWHNGGHELGEGDVVSAREWLAKTKTHIR